MSLHPVLRDKLNVAERALAQSRATPRDTRLPAIPGKAHAVIGMRRSGKSTFLHQLQAGVRAELPPERAIYLGFDDDRLAELPLAQLDLLLEEYYRRHPELRGRETVHWFLDEVQAVPGWDRFVRRILDTERIQVVVSGSSARLLSREVHTSLRGRTLPTVIHPFSFREFLRHLGEEPVRPAAEWTPAERSLVEKRFREYLEGGGFPETVGLARNLRIELLQSYVDAVLLRDIVERHGVTQVAALRWLTRQCLRNPGGRFSVHRLTADLRSQGHATGRETVNTLLDHLIDAFLVSSVPLATDSERARNTNLRKLYPADPGLIGAFDHSGRSNVGHALENVVRIEAERRQAEAGYVRLDGDREVDFLLRHRSGDCELLQVCADLAADATRQRELSALTEAARLHPRARAQVLVLTHDQAPWPADVLVRPAYEWLLEPPA